LLVLAQAETMCTIALPPVVRVLRSVNCLVPSRWMSVQYFAAASQNITCLVVTGVVLAITAAAKPDRRLPP
jgi:hypothetical protein